jgi:energy-coupling factor transporter transmembrane protein EcfT
VTGRGNPLAPSSTIALYVAGVISIYLIRDPRIAWGVGFFICIAWYLAVDQLDETIGAARWRMAIFLIAWVLAMRLLLALAGGQSLRDPDVRDLALRGAMRFAVLILGAMCVIAITPARAVVEELETTRLPRSVRLLVMMLVQYPRVLRDRYDQIVEAQVARGADRPTTIVARVNYGLRVLLPVLQSELNAIGERAGLIHMRRLDVETAVAGDGRIRTRLDAAVVALAALTTVGVIVWRILS